MFYHGVPIDHCTNFSGPFAKPISESEYNTACTVVMAIAHSIILNIEFLKKDTYEVPEQAPLNILDIKLDVCMYNNGKDTKHSRHIA